MPTLRRILKYMPAVVMGLLVVAWVVSFFGAYIIGFDSPYNPPTKPLSTSRKRLPRYEIESDGGTLDLLVPALLIDFQFSSAEE